MAKKTRTQLSADASNVNILDNTSQQVTPAKVRNQYTDERDSVINYVDDFTGSVGDLLTIGTDGESITWIPVSDVQTPPGGSTGDIQINAGGGNFGATTDIVITSGDVSIPNGNLSVDGNLNIESSLPILSLRDSDTINSAGRIDFKDGTNSIKAQIGYNSTDGFDFTTTSSFTFDGGDATFSGDVTIDTGLDATKLVVSADGTNDGTDFPEVQIFSTRNGSYTATGDVVARLSFLSNDASGTTSQKESTIDMVSGVTTGSHMGLSFKVADTDGTKEALYIQGVDQSATFSGDVSATGTITSNTQLLLDRSSDATNSGILITGDAGYFKYLQLKTGGSRRWNIGSDATAESGGNAGSNFVIEGYSNSNVSLGNYFEIKRATGKATFSGDVGINGAGTTFPLNILSDTQQLAVDIDGQNTTATILNIDNDNANAQSFIRFQNQASSTSAIGYNDNLDVVGISHSATLTSPEFYIDNNGDSTVTGELALSAYGSGSKTGTATYALGVDASGNVVETSALIAGGIWTPTFSALSSNLTSVVCPGGNTAFYQRVGNIVSFSVNVNITYSSSGSHSFDVSLPISSNFTDSSSVAGVVSSTFNNTNFSGGGVTCDAVDALEVNLQTTGSGTTITGIMFSGHYEIK